MVEINFKVFIAGILALAAIEMTLIICGHEDASVTSMIIGIIALAAGFVIPAPGVDGKKGTLYFPDIKGKRSEDKSGVL